MAIDNLKGGTKRGIGENTIDNLRGGTKRVYEENTINNLRGGTKRVILIGGGGGNIDELNVTPSTSAQTITASGGTDGYSPVNVSAVDASIDANIVAGNIKKDVTILGVTGTYEAGGGSGLNIELERYEDPDVAGYYLLRHNTTASIISVTQPTEIVSENYMFYRAYYNNTSLSGTVDLSNITAAQGGNLCFGSAFAGCTGITKIDMSNCTNGNSTSTSNTFATFYDFARNATSLQEVDMSKMVTIDGFNSSFYGCTSLVTVKLDSLSNIGNVQNGWQNAFRNTALTELRLPAFRIRGSRVNQFSGMFNGVANVTLHCPANMQSSVEAMTGYSTTAPFGATAGTVLFDLPSTFLLTGADGYTYERNPHFDTPSALSWRRTSDYDTYNWRINWNNPYYTSGTTDPSVSDTIYSDSACTTPATTISSIA